MTNLTIYTTFNLADAQLVRSRLDAAGFHPFVADECGALMGGGYSYATGGIRVQVPDTEAAEAREFLNSETTELPAP